MALLTKLPGERAGPKATGLALALLLAAPAAPSRADASSASEVRFGIARELFRGVNDNDAAVAIAAYARTVGDEYGIPVRAVVLEGPQGVREALERKQVDMFDVPTAAIFDLDENEMEGPLIVSSSGPTPFEQYVLLVRSDGPIKAVADLRGRKLAQSNDERASLARVWLEVLLYRQGLGSPERLGRLDLAPRAAQAILPVFFGKYDACVVTRNAWDVMGEMNPQLKVQLRAVETSTPLLPGMAMFRRGIPGALKQRILDAVADSQRTASFWQILTLFKITSVTVLPNSAFDSTRQLLAIHRDMASESRRSKRAVPHVVAR